MSFGDNPIKVVEVKGHVGLNGKTVCRVHLQPQYLNICIGKWQIALKDVKIITNEFVEPVPLQDLIFFEVSTNIVQGHLRDSVPLGLFTHVNNFQRLHSFLPLVWLQTNMPSAELVVYIQRVLKGAEDCDIEKPFDFSLTILLQRIM